jgi:hypothetical protein
MLPGYCATKGPGIAPQREVYAGVRLLAKAVAMEYAAVAVGSEPI